MTRDRQTIVVLGVVLLLVFGAAAATLETTVTSTSGTGDGASGGSDAPDEDDEGVDLANVSDGIFPESDLWLEETNDSGAEEGDDIEGDSGGDEGSNTSSPRIPTEGLVVLAAVLLAIIGVVVWRSGSGQPAESDPVDDEADDQGALTAVGVTAGEVADELAAGAEPENVVYRTWIDMTRQLDVDRRSSRTPGEFAAAAIDAGMRPDDVRTLTQVFEQVRYGDEPVTETRRRQAIEALRHITERYGTEGDDG